MSFDGYESLHQWSVAHIPEFWSSLWEFCGIIGEAGSVVVDNPNKLPGARWFPKGSLNYAENLLRPRREADDVLVFRGEDKVETRFSYKDVHDTVSRIQQALKATGVCKGDCIAAYMPNMPETVMFMLAATALGAVWSSASPDFGVQGVIDRFGQIKPTLLLTVDGYFYNGKTYDIRDKVRHIVQELPTVQHVIVVPYTAANPDVSNIPKTQLWGTFLAPYTACPLEFVRLPFDHPLFVMFSSGTTGAPKCILHGHGGTLCNK